MSARAAGAANRAARNARLNSFELFKRVTEHSPLEGGSLADGKRIAEPEQAGRFIKVEYLNLQARGTGTGTVPFNLLARKRGRLDLACDVVEQGDAHHQD